MTKTTGRKGRARQEFFFAGSSSKLRAARWLPESPLSLVKSFLAVARMVADEIKPDRQAWGRQGPCAMLHGGSPCRPLQLPVWLISSDPIRATRNGFHERKGTFWKPPCSAKLWNWSPKKNSVGRALLRPVVFRHAGGLFSFTTSRPMAATRFSRKDSGAAAQFHRPANRPALCRSLRGHRHRHGAPSRHST